MAPFEGLYGRSCRTPICCLNIVDVKPLVIDLVKDDINKVRLIQATILEAQSRREKYVDHKVRYILLKVSPMKGVMRFGKRGKLSL